MSPTYDSRDEDGRIVIALAEERDRLRARVAELEADVSALEEETSRQRDRAKKAEARVLAFECILTSVVKACRDAGMPLLAMQFEWWARPANSVSDELDLCPPGVLPPVAAPDVLAQRLASAKKFEQMVTDYRVAETGRTTTNGPNLANLRPSEAVPVPTGRVGPTLREEIDQTFREGWFEGVDDALEVIGREDDGARERVALMRDGKYDEAIARALKAPPRTNEATPLADECPLHVEATDRETARMALWALFGDKPVTPLDVDALAILLGRVREDERAKRCTETAVTCPDGTDADEPADRGFVCEHEHRADKLVEAARRVLLVAKNTDFAHASVRSDYLRDLRDAVDEFDCGPTEIGSTGT